MNGTMMDLPTTMSKMLALGMPLAEVVRASTSNPADQIQRPELGRLSVGSVADVAVLRVLNGDFRYRDASGGGVAASQRIQAELTLKDGQVVWDWNSLTGDDYRDKGPAYGIREGYDFILPPPEK
jgi:dihydroorotase